MINTLWPITEFAARGLEPSEREAVLGDLTETGETGWSALQGVLGLVMRRQAPLWQTWPPWFAGIGMALPLGYLLTGVSASVSCTYERLFGPEIVIRHEWPTGHEGVLLLLCHAFLLIAWSWTVGYVSGLFSRRTAWATAGLSLIPFLFDDFHINPLPKVCLLLFVLPLFLGIYHGSAMPIQPRIALLLAAVVTGLMVFCWNSGALWILNWGLLWPVWCLVAVAMKSNGRAASRPTLAQI